LDDTRSRYGFRDHVRSLVVIMGVLSCMMAVPAHATQRLVFDVQAPVEGPKSYAGWQLEAEVSWGGQRTRLQLERQGGDHWRGELVGGPAQMAGVSLRATSPKSDTTHLVYTGLEVLTIDENALNYGLNGPAPGTATRRSIAGQGADEALVAEGVAILGVGWWMVVLIGVLSLLRRGRRGVSTGLDDAGWRIGPWGERLFWLVVALVWTWPAVLANGEQLVGRHFDAMGTIWTISAAPRLLFGLADPLTVWPEGAVYGSVDSLTLLPLSALFQWVGAVRLHAWFGVLGVAVSGWAASGFARAVGAPRPWNLIAGLLFACSGLSANALLEGHSYHLLNPWLPLFAWAWWRATGPAGGWRDGLWAGLAFSLTLLTTAYLGVAAAIIGFGLSIDALLRRPRTLMRPVLVFMAVSTPAVLWVVLGVTGDLPPITGTSEAAALRRASLNLASLGLPIAEIDRSGHSWALALSPLIGVGLLFASVVRPAQARWWPLVGTTALALALMMGPVMALANDPGDPTFASPFGGLWQLPGWSQLRFPGRLGWAFNLMGGVLAAQFAAQVARRVGRPARWILVAVLVESLFLVGLPFRQVLRPTMAKDISSIEDKPLFSLLPESLGPAGEGTSWMGAVDCLAQASHAAPIALDCVRLPVSESSGVALSRWVGSQILSGRAPRAWAHLSALGFDGILWRPDWVHPSLAVRLGSAFDELGAPQRVGETGWSRYSLSTTTPALARVDVGEVALQITGGEPPGVVQLWRPHLRVAVPSAAPPARYFVQIKHGGKVEQMPLWDDGRVPGDIILDGVWLGRAEVVLMGAVVVSLERVRSGERTTLWEGPVEPVTGREDPIAFVVDEHTATARPALAAFPLPVAKQIDRVAWIHSVGVLLFVGCGLLGLVWVRRQR
jgi:hypothetical protein